MNGKDNYQHYASSQINKRIILFLYTLQIIYENDQQGSASFYSFEFSIVARLGGQIHRKNIYIGRVLFSLISERGNTRKKNVCDSN